MISLQASHKPRHSSYLWKNWSILCLLTIVWTLSWGDLPLNELLPGAWHRWAHGETSWNALLDERIPRVIVLLLTGAALATSGALMQSLFQNPLAAPTVLGITSGGTLWIMILSFTSFAVRLPFLLPLAGLGGCLATLLIVYLLARRQGMISSQSLILTGIGLSTFLIAVQGAILYAFRENWALIQKITEWEAGTTLDRSWLHVHMQLPLAFVGLLAPFAYRQEIDLLSLGEEQAKSLGVEVEKVRWRLFLSVALLVGGALTAVGNIPFFGLMVPHLFRNLWGSNHRVLIPLCALGGGTLLLFFDTFLRFMEIHSLSLAHLFGILGGFFFIYLLIYRDRRGIQSREH